MSKLGILIVSLLLTLTLPIILALSVLFVWGWGIAIIVFWGAIFVEFLVDNVAKYRLEKRYELQLATLNRDAKEIESRKLLNTHCAYCNRTNVIKLFENDNKYVCRYCQQENKVKVDIHSIRITTPVNIKADVTNIFKSIDTKEPDGSGDK